MRKSNLLAAAAIVGLIGGTSLAIGQGSSGSGKSGGGAGAAAPGAAETSSPSSASTGGTNAKQGSEQRSGNGSSAAESKSSERQKSQSVQSGGKPGQTGETMPTSQRKGEAKGEAREGYSGAAPSSGSAAKGGSAHLSSQQRTKIHQTIIKQGNAPRVSNVNFSVSVGTTVPRSVQLVAVPTAIIEIHPAWRGYEYFMVGNRVVIVDPNTMQIVAVISA
jgi:hypothetical protein